MAASATCGAQAPAETSVESLLRDLQSVGIDVLFSSDLVPPDLLAPAPQAGHTPMQLAAEALAAHGLELKPIATNKYVVVRSSVAQAPPAEVSAPLQVISVYASRYSMSGPGVTDPHELSSSDIGVVPGSHDDALRALKSLPGLASNASGRPYIRGSLADDVLVRYDGITLLDPFHFKNFQSLISAIDPAVVERIEVFSGGFPVRYGTRSGGVIDVTAPSSAPGYENRVALSLISGGASTMGSSEKLPLDWLFAIRRGTLDLIDPVEDSFGQPRYSDSIGRLRWKTEKGAWTLGWLLLDDKLELGTDGDDETAQARYRDEYIWVARDHEFDSKLRTRGTAIVTSTDRHRSGLLDQPGVAVGTLDSKLEFDRVELNNLWIWDSSDNTTYTFGGEAAVSRAEYEYTRSALYDPAIAAAFNRSTVNDLDFAIDPKVFTYALHAARRQRWESFEAELGLRLDAQDYNFGGNHAQISPRLNLRYDFSDRLRLYTSVGRFSQAQHVEEWRVEDAQTDADSAQVSLHTILGLTLETSDSTHWGIEAYSKRWTTVAPYFDNLLDPLSLNPDIAPDRVRIAPHESEAAGLELNMRRQFSDRLTGWGTLSWSRVADDTPQSDELRSWDQPIALTAGVAWQGSRLGLSALGGWHRGWPRTPFETQPTLLIGARNSQRWGDFYTLDLRGNYVWPLTRGDLSLVIEATNATNRSNECCAVLQASDNAAFFEADTKHWLPAIVNIGFSYSWRRRD